MAACAAALLLAVAFAAPAAPAGHPYFKMKQVPIIDPSGLGKPTPAAELMIPTDWKFRSNVQWANRGCFVDLAAVTFRAQSPDGRLVVEGFPSFSWQYVNDPKVRDYLVKENQEGAKFGLKPCPVFPPAHAAALLQKKVLPEVRPGKQIVSLDSVPDLDQLISARQAQVEAQSARSGRTVQMRAESARARLKYDLDGQPVEEWVIAVSMAQDSPISTGSGTAHGIDCRATMLFAMRAPEGQLDANEKLFQTIRRSLRWEPEWQRAYLAAVDKLSSRQQIERRKRAAIWAKLYQNEIGVINGIIANSQAGADQAFMGADELIRGVESYRDPATGHTYELSNQYGHAWMNGSNEYVLSDDPSFNPQSVLNGSWTALEHVQRNP